MGRFIDVMEHLPDPETYHVVYSEIFGCYHIARFSPVTGWVDIKGKELQSVTSWDIDEVLLPYAVTNEFNRDAVLKYGLEKSDYFRVQFLHSPKDES